MVGIGVPPGSAGGQLGRVPVYHPTSCNPSRKGARYLHGPAIPTADQKRFDANVASSDHAKWDWIRPVLMN